jgi:CSLREA domain-containing protein
VLLDNVMCGINQHKGRNMGLNASRSLNGVVRWATPVRRMLALSAVGAITLTSVLTATSSSASTVVRSNATIAPRLSAPPLTFVVNTTIDSHDLAPGNSKCLDGSSKCSLRAAIEEADALLRPVIIKLSSATYPTTLGALALTSKYGITIVGVSPAKTTIDASSTGDRAFLLNAQDATAIISNLTITGGTAPSGGSASLSGGDIALLNNTASLTLNAVTISHGSAGNEGGAIYSKGALWINQSTLSFNNVSSSNQAEGGAIYQANGSLQTTNTSFTHNNAIGTGTSAARGGAVFANSGTEIVGGSFTNNSATSVSTIASGGALASGEQISIFGTTFSANSAGPGVSATNVTAYGGAISSCYGASLFSHIIVTHNTATSTGSGDVFGGGINIECGATVLTSPTISHNTASATGSGSAYGGGLSIGDTNGTGDSAVAVITKAVISSNISTTSAGKANGGGISIYSGNNGSGGLTLTDSTVNSNHANSPASSTGAGIGGGGIFDNSCGAGSIITSTTVAFNVALNSQGGGVYNDSCGETFVNDKILSNQALGSLTGGSPVSAQGTGGGLSLYDTTRVVNTLVANNTATQNGGGVYSDDVQQFIGDTLRANRANHGAGLFIDSYGNYRSTAIVDNVGTGVASQGGGIYFNDDSDFFNSTIAGNVASSGAGLFTTSGSGGVLRATLVAGNHRTGTMLENDCQLNGAGDIGSAGGNRIGDLSCSLHAVQDRQGKPDVGYNVLSPSGRVYNFNTTSYGAGSSTTTSATGAFVGLANSPDGQGYWTVSTHGHVLAYGSAHNYGSANGQSIVAIAATPDGAGYWLLGANGVVHPYGSAAQLGNAPSASVAMAPTPDGQGYWIVGTNGKVSHFGSAVALGSAAGQHVVGIAAAPDGQGYWLATSNGAVSNFGTAGAHGSSLGKSVVAIAAAPDGQGFWLLGSNGAIYPHGNEPTKGSPLTTFHTGSHESAIGSM